MFKILIKHIIYDRCVDVFFDKLTYNFIHLKYSKHKITMKSMYDMKSMHGVDLDNPVLDALRDEITSSIDTEILASIEEEIFDSISTEMTSDMISMNTHTGSTYYV